MSIWLTVACRTSDSWVRILALLVGGEGVDHALDGVGGAGGVQRGEHQLRHLGSVDGGADGLGVAHLAEQDDVGAFAHG